MLVKEGELSKRMNGLLAMLFVLIAGGQRFSFFSSFYTGSTN